MSVRREHAGVGRGCERRPAAAGGDAFASTLHNLPGPIWRRPAFCVVSPLTPIRLDSAQGGTARSAPSHATRHAPTSGRAVFMSRGKRDRDSVGLPCLLRRRPHACRPGVVRARTTWGQEEKPADDHVLTAPDQPTRVAMLQVVATFRHLTELTLSHFSLVPAAPAFEPQRKPDPR